MKCKFRRKKISFFIHAATKGDTEVGKNDKTRQSKK